MRAQDLTNLVIRRSPIRFRPKPRELKSIGIWANRPSSMGSKLLFPVIKANKIKTWFSVDELFILNVQHLKNCRTRAGFATLHGLVYASTLVLQIHIAFAPRTKRRLYVLRCGCWLVKTVSSDFGLWSSTLKNHGHKMPWHGLEHV